MAGAGLIVIKRRIKSIKNTRKITKAMGLIATAKLRKCRQILDKNQKYNNYFESIIDQLVDNAEESNIYIDGNKSKSKLYIALTSDSGLCGGYNGSIVNAAAQEMRKDKDNSQLIVVGQKGRMYFKRLKYETLSEYVDIPEVPTEREANTIVKHAIKLYKEGKVGEVYVVYTKFYSAVKQVTEVKKILPLQSENKNLNGSYINFEPDYNSALNNSIPLYLKNQFLNLMINSKASEQGSRMTAMNGATQNANDLINKLNLKYNRIRQSAITQEISEIVGGAEAQK